MDGDVQGTETSSEVEPQARVKSLAVNPEGEVLLCWTHQKDRLRQASTKLEGQRPNRENLAKTRSDLKDYLRFTRPWELNSKREGKTRS